MEIVHVEKDGNFTWMKNIHLRDRFLSLKAKPSGAGRDCVDHRGGAGNARRRV